MVFIGTVDLENHFNNTNAIAVVLFEHSYLQLFHYRSSWVLDNLDYMSYPSGGCCSDFYSLSFEAYANIILKIVGGGGNGGLHGWGVEATVAIAINLAYIKHVFFKP